ncbi:type IV secretion protein IcmC [Legionella dresdenensis]|uniref:Type IV secretion protein IcmC n=1 Tax=Legionella dresdenensis TaxID=450200 RepID=A0ABV8CDU8_9GAMM
MADSSSLSSWVSGQADILANLASNMVPVQRLITGAAYIIGLAFAFKAIFTLKSYGESKTMMSSQTNIKEPLLHMFVAAIFIYFPSGLDAMLATTFGSSNILQYAPVDSSNQAISSLFGSGSLVGQSLTRIIQTIGLIAFVRGWVLIAKGAGQGQQPGGTGKGLMHIFGGILAINIVLTLQIINNTLYGTN